MDTPMDQQPSRSIKLFSWLILGSLSVFFAEVVSGSDMFPYFNSWGIIAIIPLYTLHILVLAYVVFNIGKPRFYTLFLAGTIFGMYEAYITKVLWSPSWGDPLFLLGGVAAVESVVLVLFWHPFWAFIIPLFVGENLLSNSNEIVNGLPDRAKRMLNARRSYLFVPLFAFLAGMLQSGNSPSPGLSLLSGFSTLGFLIVLIIMWRKVTKGREYSLRQLLPSHKEFKVILSLLILLYVTMSLVIRLDILPGLLPQLTIWLMYAALFVLLYLHVNGSKKATIPETINLPRPVKLKKLVLFSLIFTFASAIFTAADVGLVIMVLMWFGGGALGIFLLVQSIRDLSV
ncbi:MAG: hypothetical protein MIO93_14035 [ANME-2 cluster archaeon]|jgi:hypothetical protein|nr:hypothetical protein [ANME-2 cluster archaeon]